LVVLLLLGEEDDEVPVADPTPLFASEVVVQVYVPRITWPPDFLADCLSKVEQSI
jgi:hypothetical protein